MTYGITGQFLYQW